MAPSFIVLDNCLSLILATEETNVSWMLWQTTSPVNLVDAYDDRLPFACAFAVTSTCILDLFTGSFYYQPDVSDIPSMLSGTIQVLICFVNVIEVCIVYYPLLLCLSTPASLLGNFIGFLYTANWLFFYIIRFADCPVDSGVVGDLYAEILGPVYACYVILLVRFAWGLFKDVKLWYQSYKETKTMNVVLSRSSITPIAAADMIEDNDPIFCAFTKSHYYKYVLTLLHKPKEEDVGRCRKYISKVYKNIPYFRYSTRFICTFVLSVLTLHQVGILYTYAVKEKLDELFKTLFNDTYIPEEDLSRPDGNITDDYNYAKELFQVASGCKYALFGIPNRIHAMGLTLVIGYAFFYGQVFAIKYCCLQEKGKVLGLDNRRWFHVATYTLFFFHVITGLVSCLLRIIKSLIFGAIFIGRIDRCVLMRGFELWDSGYKAYFGFLNLEVSHTHPVLVTFCHLLWSSTRSKRWESIVSKDETNYGAVRLTSTQSRSKVARNRWFVAITLMRNQHVFVNRAALLPELERIRNDKKEEKKSKEKSMVSTANDVLDSVATATVIAMTGGD
ncbi:stimulated by retinoic acid gene 6 protein-like [Antedon mediterranea]|uniref:stimulated by retinoic acid gene 6 protein-like n=1 Tax=Antedon mediterranea TaxID=105859 RepID=UPI003AF5B79A